MRMREAFSLICCSPNQTYIYFYFVQFLNLCSTEMDVGRLMVGDGVFCLPVKIMNVYLVLLFGMEHTVRRGEMTSYPIYFLFHETLLVKL